MANNWRPCRRYQRVPASNSSDAAWSCHEVVLLIHHDSLVLPRRDVTFLFRSTIRLDGIEKTTQRRGKGTVPDPSTSAYDTLGLPPLDGKPTRRCSSKTTSSESIRNTTDYEDVLSEEACKEMLPSQRRPSGRDVCNLDGRRRTQERQLLHSKSTHSRPTTSSPHPAKRGTRTTPLRVSTGKFHPASRPAARGPFTTDAGHSGHNESL